jgi:hypothetical protein
LRGWRVDVVPNRHPLTEISAVQENGMRRQRADGGRMSWFQRNICGDPVRPSAGSVLVNWAALVALWALPYLTLLDRLHIDAAQSEILQWSLLIVGTLGLVSVLYAAWSQTLDPAWRRRHGFPLRKQTIDGPTKTAV